MKRLYCYCKLTVLFFVLGFSHNISSQNDSISGIKLLDYYLTNKQVKKANTTLQLQINNYIKNNQIDSLYQYPYYVGKIELLNTNKVNATKRIEKFVDKIISNNTSYTTHYKSLLSLANFYDEISDNTKSLNTSKSALEIILKIPNASPEEIGKVKYNIGATLLPLGNINEAKKYFKNALIDFESSPKTSTSQLSDGYNAVGATMWLSSKLDSAKYYYDKAEKTIILAKGDSILNLYLGTVIKSNISLLEYSQGNLADAVKIQNNVIKNYEKVIQNSKDETIVSKAKRFQSRAVSNMAVFYNEQGNLTKAHNILEFAFKKRKENLPANDITIGTSQIQLGQSLISLKNYNQAIENLENGLKHIKENNLVNPYWKAVASHALAEAYIGLNSPEKAKQYYQKSELLFKKALGENYDVEFLNFLSNKALFLANYGTPKDAIATSKEAYSYVQKYGGEDNFALLKQMLDLANVYYITSDYKNSKYWCTQATNYLDKKHKTSTTTADSIQIDFNRPKLILLETKSDYYLENTRNSSFLNTILTALDKASNILEKRKTTIYKNEDINILLTDYKSITDFSKKINLELYQLTSDSKYLLKALSLHESSVYNRIRLRLNLRNNITFSDIPKSVLEREKNLKKKMTTSLSDSKNINIFLKASKSWNIFLDSLKQNYPKYYKMRYATINESLDNLQKNIPENTTVIRYLFIEDHLYAFVASKTEKNIFKLNNKNTLDDINQLGENQSNIDITSVKLHKLYRQLWQPFEENITSKNIIIIPDGLLFNLSFETLTPIKISSFKELTANSLLASYSISYNYSLLLLNEGRKNINYTNEFIAFVPEFNDNMKNDYKVSIIDSLNLDKTYLTLLPQPFSVDLAKQYSKLFNGKSFLNENASKQVFINEANEHKIIHIGTHAESNNISPELSRLIFAKNASNNDNSLYTYEIYNQNLNSNLAILTACETGKPTYQAGEGMISLAHAFNYAGSESILTSLWKIDEQSSTQIIKYFYNNLANGLPKDKALQQAKLSYIASAQGRTVEPQYWAGLILLGNTTPIELNSNSTLIYWVVGAVLLVIILLAFYHLNKKKTFFFYLMT